MRRQKLQQCLRELSRLVHLGHDVTAPEQLAIDEQLRDRGPVGDRRELLADPRVGQDVDGGEGRVQRLQDRDGAR
jgi:hypothetical protein